jgi:hypothetical protein
MALRTEVEDGFARLELRLVDMDQVVRQIYASNLSFCKTGFEAYHMQFNSSERYSYQKFSAWLTPLRTTNWYRDCREELSKVLSPYGNEISVLFVPTVDVDPGTAQSVQDQIANRQVLLQNVVYPTMEFAEKHKLWSAATRSRMRRPVSGYETLRDLGRDPAPDESVTSSPPNNANLVTAQGGHRFLSATEILRLSQIARTILEWTPMIREPGTRVVSEDELRKCGQSGESCDLLPVQDVIAILEDQAELLGWLLEQEHFVAGLPFVEFAAGVLENEVLPQYAQSESSSAEATQKLVKALTRSPKTDPDGKDRPYSSRYACAEKDSTAARDVLCLMQANPFFARNVLAFLIWKRLPTSDALRAYELAYSMEFVGPGAVIGNDLKLLDASIGLPDEIVPRGTGKWAIKLPRAIVADSQSAPAEHLQQPESCWHERTQQRNGPTVVYPELEWWQDELRVSSAPIASDPRWARCYLLPTPDEVRYARFGSRVELNAIAEELSAVRALIGLLQSPPETTVAEVGQ